ncbi:MAG TPA: histidine kinase, partial [Saprospiraceae bacterium]|nr:histidine kinase [Saprospiraceae bacterium]
TPDHGLIEYDGNNYKPLGINEGLGNTNIAAIAITGLGDLLISHKRGIDVMQPSRRHFIYYVDEIGLKSMDPGLNSIFTNSKGHVYVSGPNQIIKYYSTNKRLSIDPRTQITNVSVYEQPIDFSTQHHFAYNENYISFDYVGLWYSSPKSVNYLYKLDGYDRQWKESRDNAASYSSLPAGDYTFYVRASENKFFLDEPLASYSFSIGKPFWLEYWFMAAVILLSGFLLYWIVKSRERRSERQAVLKKEMIETQFQALKAQINPHFLFNSFNTLITIIDENTREPGIAIEYVEKLSDFFRSILQYREQETITLQEEWELVQNFCYLLKKRYDDNLRLHMDKPPKDAYILPLTLQMLVENAVKHNVISDRRPLDIHITIDDDDYVTVQNNLQPKSKPEPSTQFGLQSIIKRYHLLSEKKVIVDNDEHFFRVRIPIIQQPNE